MAERTCGDCTLCCNIMGIAELDKPPRRWCEHCAVGAGCTIYDARPQSCRDFTCLWLDNPATPEAMQPRRSGVVVWILRDGRYAVALTRDSDPVAWRKPAVLGTLRKLAGAGISVIAFSGRRAWAVGKHGDEEVDGAAIAEGEGGLNSITVDREVWRRVNSVRVA